MKIGVEIVSCIDSVNETLGGLIVGSYIFGMLNLTFLLYAIFTTLLSSSFVTFLTLYIFGLFGVVTVYFWSLIHTTRQGQAICDESQAIRQMLCRSGCFHNHLLFHFFTFYCVSGPFKVTHFFHLLKFGKLCKRGIERNQDRMPE